MESLRRARNRAACRRCQRRKIRCDGNTPSCGACQKAGVDCVNDGTQEVHRSYIAHMENKIKWLESVISKKCPDIDLGNDTEEPAETTLHVEEEDSVLNNPPTQPPIPNGPEFPEPQNRPLEQTTLNNSVPIAQEEPQQAHEMGFVSLFRGEDPRYIGPSSGYFFAKRILSNTGSYGKNASAATTTTGKVSQFPMELVNIPATLPQQKEVAIELSSKYFQTVHQLYPFLHEQTHMKVIDEVYKSEENDPIGSFQVYMVLAIASLNLSRRYKQQLPVEGYYTSAMKHIDYICHHGSMAALQCLLLLMLYALYNPSCKINIWNLNYQCLASTIDLGLQRDVRAASSNYPMSLFKQEMRTRVFWVAYTFDRILCTMMGRPIGIRDEACEMRLPLDISDLDLMNSTTSQPPSNGLTSHMSLAIHHFKLAKLNSTIKYVMNSINRDVPSYAFPPVRDIYTWQQDMMKTLESWHCDIPQQTDDRETGMTLYFNAKYHEMMILLLRPSPAIPELAENTFGLCLDHAFSLLRFFGELYEAQTLLYSRLVVHSVFMGTLIILHCIWKFPRTAAKFSVDQLIEKFNMSQNILSSIGEHWVEALRARDCIARLSRVTIQQLLQNQATVFPTSQFTQSNIASSNRAPDVTHPVTPGSNTQGNTFSETNEINSTVSWPRISALTTSSGHSNLFDDIMQTDFEGLSGLTDIDALISDLLNNTH